MRNALSTAPGSSPHTRGAPISTRASFNLSGIIPAYAGSTELLCPPPPAPTDHPRIRGEHQPVLSTVSVAVGSSPHTRGARRRPRPSRRPAGIIPAYAGSTSWARDKPQPGRDHPRIRGEHVGGGGGGPAGPGIIPAYAGSTAPSSPACWAATDHPRIRGEHGSSPAREGCHQGSSPHTRGALSLPEAADRRPRIIPAYAGSTCLRSTRRGAGWDHPRIRGEHRRRPARDRRRSGSSPHTRGAQIEPASRKGLGRIIPAYAGSTTTLVPGTMADEGSSPHTRGAPGRRLALVLGVGIIPAYAGSTAECSGMSGQATDHPRIRGEHPGVNRNGRGPAGSSPHTRGAH